jgi:hypothetical protein
MEPTWGSHTVHACTWSTTYRPSLSIFFLPPIMINEGRQFKFQGWLTYDKMLRQSASKSKSTSRSEFLYATTVLSQQKGESSCDTPDLSSDTTPPNVHLESEGRAAISRRNRTCSRSPEKSSQVSYAWKMESAHVAIRADKGTTYASSAEMTKRHPLCIHDIVN